jgi:hypothetical protein
MTYMIRRRVGAQQHAWRRGVLLLAGSVGATSAIVAIVLAVASASAGAGLDASGRVSAAAGSPACAGGDAAAEARQMRAYRNAGSYPARQVDNRRGLPSRVSIQIPPIAFTGPGTSSTLPLGPCQTIYRFVFHKIKTARGAARSPFAYIEVDWNTEGLPRGPNNSFTSAHFDFHFYLRPRSFIDGHLKCVSTNGRTCDPQRTRFAQMRRFLALPLAQFVPPGYFPDTGSSIPMMGLHLLDGRVHFTVDEVNHNPVLLYGTFNERLAFLEASVTQFNLQDLLMARSHKLTYRLRQPRRYEDPPWPTRFSLQYDPRTGRITAAFEGFKAHRRT